jgi:hypothetical protein
MEAATGVVFTSSAMTGTASTTGRTPSTADVDESAVLVVGVAGLTVETALFPHIDKSVLV